MSVLQQTACEPCVWALVFSGAPQSPKYNPKRNARIQGVRDTVRLPGRFGVLGWRKSGSELPHSKGGTLIVGMGVDIAEVERIQGAIERHGEVFLRRVYTTREREYCERFKNKYERYAGRFAAKEAAMKALGTGWRRGVKWVDLEVVRETSGRPTLAITGEAAKIAQQLGVKSVALSITHTESQALAQVIFEG